jgi:hypothetical protein
MALYAQDVKLLKKIFININRHNMHLKLPNSFNLLVPKNQNIYIYFLDAILRQVEILCNS